MPTDPVVFWTVRELQARWRVSHDTIERALRSRRLKGVKIGGQWRVSDGAVAKYEGRRRTRRGVETYGDPLGIYGGR